jgi:hypothetical protein
MHEFVRLWPLAGPDRQIIGIEVKASATVGGADFRRLKKLQNLTSDRFVSGIVLHDGDRVLPFGERLWAVPWLFSDVPVLDGPADLPRPPKSCAMRPYG